MLGPGADPAESISLHTAEHAVPGMRRLRRILLEVAISLALGLVSSLVLGSVLVLLGVDPHWTIYSALWVGSLFGGAHDMSAWIVVMLANWLFHSIPAMLGVHLAWTIMTRVGGPRPAAPDA